MVTAKTRPPEYAAAESASQRKGGANGSNRGSITAAFQPSLSSHAPPPPVSAGRVTKGSSEELREAAAGTAGRELKAAVSGAPEWGEMPPARGTGGNGSEESSGRALTQEAWRQDSQPSAAAAEAAGGARGQSSMELASTPPPSPSLSPPHSPSLSIVGSASAPPRISKAHTPVKTQTKARTQPKAQAQVDASLQADAPVQVKAQAHTKLPAQVRKSLAGCEEVLGVVRRVTFVNEESGFAILQLERAQEKSRKAQGSSDGEASSAASAAGALAGSAAVPASQQQVSPGLGRGRQGRAPALGAGRGGRGGAFRGSLSSPGAGIASSAAAVQNKVTVKGSLAGVKVGTVLRVTGRWQQSSYGRQLVAERWEVERPTSQKDIEG